MLDDILLIVSRSFEQTFKYVERVATTKIQSDIEALTLELNEYEPFGMVPLIFFFRKLRSLKLERLSDRKKVTLHPFEVSSLANLVKDVSNDDAMTSLY